MTKNQTLPELHIFAREHQSKAGYYHIRVTDPHKQKVILEHEIKHQAGNLQAQYMTSLLEGHVGGERREELARYGHYLYKQLFQDGRQLNHYLKTNPHLHQGVRFVLRFNHSASELWNVPWEYMHDGRQFMLLENQHMIVRTPHLNASQRRELTGLNERPSPLRILVIFSEPDGVAPLDMDNEAKLIVEALEDAQAKNQVIIDIVEEGSLYSLQRQLQEHDYHILHYSGHGTVIDGRSCLILEGIFGDPTPVFVDDLVPLLSKQAPNLRLALLGGCKTGQFDETEAMNNLANGLLHVIPAVIAMQFSIIDYNAIAFARSFYGAIGQGDTLEDAMAAARREMQHSKLKLHDWGVPAIYLRSRNIRMIDPQAPPIEAPAQPALEFGHLPRPDIFVGRRPELRRLRKALLDGQINILYVWGIGGIGKSALVGRLLERPGRAEAIEDVLVIDCTQAAEATEIPQTIIQWLHQKGCREAVKIITTAGKPIVERIVQASQTMAERRLAIVLDGFDALLTDHNGRWQLEDERLQVFLTGLTHANWSTRLIITSRFYWAFLNSLNAERYREVQLKNLDSQIIFRAARILPSVLKAPSEQQFLVGVRSGGHPFTLEIIDQYIQNHPEQSLEEILADEALLKYIGDYWHATYLKPLLHSLSSQERKALAAVSVLDGSFWEEHIRLIAQLNYETAAHVMARFDILSLIQYERTDEEGDVWYSLQPVVKWIMYNQLSPESKRKYHLRAAGMAAQFFIDTAEQRYQERKLPLPSSKRLQAAERMVRELVQHYDVNLARTVMKQALIWRDHLYAGQAYHEAANLVLHTWFMLDKWGDRPLARKLIDETIETTTTNDKALAQVNLAQLLMHEGELERAMNICNNAYDYFKQQKDDHNLAVVLSKQGAIYARQGNWRQAQKKEEAALRLEQLNENISGQIASLTVLTDICFQRNDMRKAISYSEDAEALALKAGDLQNLAIIFHDRGRMWLDKGQLDNALNYFGASLKIAGQLDHKAHISRVLAQISIVLRHKGDLSSAKKAILDSLSIAQALNDHNAVGLRYLHLGQIHEAEGNKEEALIMYQRSEQLLDEHGTPDQIKLIRSQIKQIKRGR